MDCFFEAVPLKRKARLHFHEFMREVHRELHDLQGTANPLDVLGERMSHRYKLICFDEFHVADITDALILHRLLEALHTHEVGFVTTSNFKPDDLYPGGMHRDRVLGAIEFLNQHMQVINVDNGVDYRRLAMGALDLYHVPNGSAADQAMALAFSKLAEAQEGDRALRIEQRSILARRRAGGVVWFDFQELCGGPRSQNDYLEIANTFHTVIVAGVPHMPPRLTNEARRFIWLIDVLYDHRVKLIMSAEVPPDQLYTEGQVVDEFARTVSRLIEMQSRDYIESPRRIINAHLT
jgi:cell division protein ZapE